MFLKVTAFCGVVVYTSTSKIRWDTAAVTSFRARSVQRTAKVSAGGLGSVGLISFWEKLHS